MFTLTTTYISGHALNIVANIRGVFIRFNKLHRPSQPTSLSTRKDCNCYTLQLSETTPRIPPACFTLLRHQFSLHMHPPPPSGSTSAWYKSPPSPNLPPPPSLVNHSFPTPVSSLRLRRRVKLPDNLRLHAFVYPLAMLRQTAPPPKRLAALIATERPAPFMQNQPMPLAIARL